LNTKRNISFDIYRIMFTTFILLHHFHMYSDELPYGGGYMATDFFFILSGFLMYKGFDKEEGEHKSLLSYLGKRYVRLFVPLVVCNLLLLLVATIIYGFSLPGGIGGFIKENLMIEIMVSDSNRRFNPPTWYLGILLLASAVIYAVLLLSRNAKSQKLIRTVVFGILFLTYLGIIFVNTNGNIFPQYSAVIDINSAIRGISGTAVGALIGGMKVEANIPLRKSVMYVVFPLFFAYMLLWENGYTRADILIYVVVALAIWMCSIEAKKPEEQMDNNGPEGLLAGAIKGIKLVSSASYIAYLIHYPLVQIMAKRDVFAGLDWKIYSVIYLIIIWLLAIVVDAGIKAVGKVGKAYNEIKR